MESQVNWFRPQKEDYQPAAGGFQPAAPRMVGVIPR